MFNVVSVCSYGNTLDDKKIEEVLRNKLIKWKDEGKTNEELNFETQNWKTLEAKRIFVDNSFDFMIQSIGVYENKDLVKKSCAILEDKLIHFLDALQNDEFQSNFIKWKFGINYKTNRLIEIYKKPHHR